MGYVDATRRDLVTAFLSFLAVAIVFAAAGGRIPPSFLPRALDPVISAIPHVNVVISLVAIGTIVAGWRSARAGRIKMHRNAMVISAGLFALFLILYLYRLTMLGGPTPFDGSESLYRFVYVPLLGIHILLAVVCVPLIMDALALGLTTPINQLPRTRHPAIGRAGAPLWILSFVLGIGVYLLLYWV